MVQLLDSLSSHQGILITAPPGWGKTYRLLEAIKKTKAKVCFVFPLRALCDEVYYAAKEKKISVINPKSRRDIEQGKDVSLVVVTPELLLSFSELGEFIYILDEFHLFYYWGDSFRHQMLELYYQLVCQSVPLIFLSATFNSDLKIRLEKDLEYYYQDIYQIDFGNQQLKNYPTRIYYYPFFLKNWLEDDYLYSFNKKSCQVIFCQYREEVRRVEEKLKRFGYQVISCVGGEAKEFVAKLEQGHHWDFIVATSVIGHGVNLSRIENLYFTYKVENLDFYLQMIGRGGRSGETFFIHTFNGHYFSKKELFFGFLLVFLKRVGNKIKSLLYYLYAC